MADTLLQNKECFPKWLHILRPKGEARCACGERNTETRKEKYIETRKQKYTHREREMNKEYAQMRKGVKAGFSSKRNRATRKKRSRLANR